MGMYKELMKSSLRRRWANGRKTVQQAYQSLKTALFKGEKGWQRDIDEYREKCSRPLTKKQEEHLGKLSDNKRAERLKREEVERLEAAGFDPSKE